MLLRNIIQFNVNQNQERRTGMPTAKQKGAQPTEKIRIPQSSHLANIVLSIIIGLTVLSCSNQPDNLYDIVKVSANGETSLNNFSKSYFLYSINTDSTSSSAILLEEGDMVYIDESFMDYYQKSNTREYNIKVNDSLLYINEKLASIRISPHDNTLPIFAQLSNSDIKALRSLVFDDAIPGDYLPYIEKIAAINADIGLIVPLNNTTKSIVEMFEPLWIYTEVAQKDFDLLASLTQTRVLILGPGDSVFSKALPHMPELKQLILLESEFDEEIKDDFLANNHQIEKISFMDCDLSGLSMIKNLNNLKSLSLIDLNEKFLSLTKLNTFNQLEALNLIISSEKQINMEPLNAFSSLRWLAVPPEIKQDEFNVIIKKNKDLEVLELISCENVSDMTALKNLTKLTALVVSDSLYDGTTPKTLKQLKYLSIPDETFKDSTYLATLKMSLPDCTIVPNTGFCLGSGWIFLLFPLIIIFVFRKKYLSANRKS